VDEQAGSQAGSGLDGGSIGPDVWSTHADVWTRMCLQLAGVATTSACASSGRATGACRSLSNESSETAAKFW
jgi:hypothetical protein